MVSTLDFRSEGSVVRRPVSCHRVVSLDKKLYPTWYRRHTAAYCCILSVASYYRNRVKLRSCGPPWMVCDFT